MPRWASAAVQSQARLRQLEGGSVRASAPNGAPKKLIEVVQERQWPPATSRQ